MNLYDFSHMCKCITFFNNSFVDYLNLPEGNLIISNFSD